MLNNIEALSQIHLRRWVNYSINHLLLIQLSARLIKLSHAGSLFAWTCVMKKRYFTLDGLRGIAALLVVVFHTGYRLGSWMPRFGYLAVDLFFLLSGFVLAVSYEPRLSAGMGLKSFFVARTIRLYPVYFIGLILGGLVAPLNLLWPMPVGEIGSGELLGLFGLPSGAKHADLIFPVNVPLWSIFFEFWLANLTFGLFRGRPSKHWLAAIIITSGILLIVSEKLFYTMDVGARWNSLFWGVPRVFFSFYLGVALARVHHRLPTSFGAPPTLLMLSVPALLSMPLSARLGHVYELLCVFVMFPIVILLGSNIAETRPRLGAALGEASYALYAVHFPLYLLGVWLLAQFSLEPSWKWQVIFLPIVFAFAWQVSRVDLRIRQWLTGRAFAVGLTS
jgi:peptidoglycan/LPS O-acetylase OafA/YrhL